MKISIVTVTLNNAAGLEKTMNSVISQKPFKGESPLELEYLIIDGGSIDNTAQLLKAYAERFAECSIEYRVYSESDRGIYHAMNKGISYATGDVIGFLNSGDWYEEDTTCVVAQTFLEQPQLTLVFGDLLLHKQSGKTFRKRARVRAFQTSRDWNHPTTFVKTRVAAEHPFKELGIYDDYSFYLELMKEKHQVLALPNVLAHFMMGGISNEKRLRNVPNRIYQRYYHCYRRNGYSRWYLLESIVQEVAKYLLT